MMNYFWGLGFFWMLALFTLGILLFVFWIWMLIEALKKRDVLWIALLTIGIFTGIFGLLFALLYYLLEYSKKETVKKRIRQER